MNLKEKYAVENKAVNEYLKDVIKNHEKCLFCSFNHRGICFFAYECVKNNFKFYNREN